MKRTAKHTLFFLHAIVVISLCLTGCAELGSTEYAFGQFPSLPSNSKQYVALTLNGSKHWVLTYAGSLTSAKPGSDDVYDENQTRMGRLEVEVAWRDDGVEYSSSVSSTLNGQPMADTNGDFGSSFIPDSSCSTNYGIAHSLIRISDLINFIPSDKATRYRRQVSVSPNIWDDVSVQPNVATMHVIGKTITVSLIEIVNKSRNTAGQPYKTSQRVYISDLVPGRIVKVETAHEVKGFLIHASSAILVSAVPN